MRLYEEHNQQDQHYNRQKNKENSFDFNSNTSQVAQSDRHSHNFQNNNTKKQSSGLVKKRDQFRQQIRKQYLRSYFHKKRVEMFGWMGNDKNNKQIQSVGFSQLQIGEIQIGNYNNGSSSYHHDTESNNYSILDHSHRPAYNQNYFKDVILLQKLISTSNYDEQNHLNKNHPQINDESIIKHLYIKQQQQPNFRYKSFYSFLVTTIQQNLNHVYFQQLIIKDNNFYQHQHQHQQRLLFDYHFNTLKQILYKKLTQQLQDLLISIQQFNLSKNKRNTWAYHNILLQTYSKLIYQITYFIKSQNLQFTTRSNNNYNDNNKNKNKNNKWPVISIQQQLSFLLNMLISITYFDEIQQEIVQNENEQQNVYNSLANKTLNQLLQQQDNQENDSLKVQMTRIMIDNTQLLDTLKFLIVFGPLSQNGQCQQYIEEKQQGSYLNINYNKNRDNKRRQRIISLVILLLRNVSINIGSDILFQNGLIAELKCILKQPYYKVEIRRKRQKRQQQQQQQLTHLSKQQQLQINKTINKKPLLHYRIQSLLIDIIQMIRQQQSQQYLSSMDSFQFVFDSLQYIYSIIKTTKRQLLQLQQQYERSNNNSRLLVGNAIELVDREMERNSYQDYDSQQNHCQQQQIKQLLKQQNQIRLTRLAQQCIQCLKFHFYLGQIKLTINQYNQYNHQSKNNHFISQYHGNYQQIQFQQQRSCMNYHKKVNHINKFSTKNRYVVKFNYIPNAQQILMAFQQGKYLLNLIPQY